MARRAPFPSRLFLAAVVLSALVLASLAAAAPALAQAGAQPKRGGVIRIAEREAPGLDPHLSISFLTHSYVSLAYSQLVRFPTGRSRSRPPTSRSCPTWPRSGRSPRTARSTPSASERASSSTTSRR